MTLFLLSLRAFRSSFRTSRHFYFTMDRRESSVHENHSTEYLNENTTPLKSQKPYPDEKIFKKPETINTSHIRDSFDKARFGGLTYSARTVHPTRRHTESFCPTVFQIILLFE